MMTSARSALGRESYILVNSKRLLREKNSILASFLMHEMLFFTKLVNQKKFLLEFLLPKKLTSNIDLESLNAFVCEKKF
jgi:hypothetical protein